MDRYWQALIESFGSPESYIKLALVAATYPIWGKIAKAMWEEIKESLAPEGGLWAREERRAARREPGLDPFQNIPTPSYRQVLEKRTKANRSRRMRNRSARESDLLREVASVSAPSMRERGFKQGPKKRGF